MCENKERKKKNSDGSNSNNNNKQPHPNKRERNVKTKISQRLNVRHELEKGARMRILLLTLRHFVCNSFHLRAYVMSETAMKAFFTLCAIFFPRKKAKKYSCVHHSRHESYLGSCKHKHKSMMLFCLCMCMCVCVFFLLATLGAFSKIIAFLLLFTVECFFIPLASLVSS